MVHWNKTHCNKLKTYIEECRAELNWDSSTNDVGHCNSLHKKMSRLLVQEDLYWEQRVNTSWYQDGDLNTKFIHTSSTVTRKVNKISSLEDASMVQVTNKAQMANGINQNRRLP